MLAGIDERLVKAIRAYKPQRAILFGSQVTDEADEFSDYDLVLVKETDRPFLERLKEFALMLPNGLPRVDAFIYTPREFKLMKQSQNPLVSRAMAEGRVIYEASN